MRTGTMLALLLIVSVALCGSACAQVAPATSTVACFCTPDPGGGASAALPFVCTITPSGTAPSEDVNVTVTANDAFGLPVAGSTITVTSFPVGGVIGWDNGLLPVGDTPDNPQVGLTNALGVFTAVFDEGGVAPPAPAVPATWSVAVVAVGPIPGFPPVVLAPCAPLTIRGYDLNATGTVNLIDFAIFGADLGGGATRSDFNASGAVTLIDFALFAAEMGASVDLQ